jgi:hypothetical protein
MHVVGKLRQWMKMMIHVVSVEMVVNYFAVTIAHQHIMKLACLPRYKASLPCQLFIPYRYVSKF